MKNTYAYFIILLVYFCSLSAFAQNLDKVNLSVMKPASLDHEEKSLKDNIVFPKNHTEQIAVVKCEAHIAAVSGKFKLIRCYQDNKSHPDHRNSIIQASRVSRAVPALLEGRPIGSLVRFSVFFQPLNEERKVTVIPNHMHQSELYGYEYYAPQLYEGNLPRCFTTFSTRIVKGFDVNAIVNVDTLGNVDSVEVVAENGEAPCHDPTINSVSKWKYIPALVDGIAVDGISSHVVFGDEPWWNNKIQLNRGAR